MSNYVELPIVGIFITLMGFYASRQLIKKYSFLSSGLVLWTVLFILGTLYVLDINFDAYWNGGSWVSMLLGPSVIALGVSLYEHSNKLWKQLKPFLISVVTGGIIGIVSVVLLLLQFKVQPEIIKSIAPKSITSPIAIEVAQSIKGVPEITAGIVIFTGILGSVFGPVFLKIIGNKNNSAMGVALGTTAHGIGTAKAYELSNVSGVYGGLAMCVNGVISAVMIPYIVELMM